VLDVYTQAPTPAQQEAQRAVLSLVFSADASAAVEFSLTVLERMAGTTRLELATSAGTEWEHQVLPTTYKAVGDCQVLENTQKTNTFRVVVTSGSKKAILSHPWPVQPSC
jgi:hypothetical protein